MTKNASASFLFNTTATPTAARSVRTHWTLWAAYASLISLSIYELVRNERRDRRRSQQPERMKGFEHIVTENTGMLKLLGPGGAGGAVQRDGDAPGRDRNR